MPLNKSQVEITFSHEYSQSYDEHVKSHKLFFISKRLIDIIGALFTLIFTSPLFIFIVILYSKGEQKGPVFFRQKRVGKNGKRFHIYKFRSMVVNAETKLRENKVLYKKYIDNNYKLEPDEDPRITKIGRFLRSTSLDELPQLINVLKGDMSLIGPRPVVLEELREYKGKEEAFLSVKPGITGYWQVCGRSNVGYPERVDIELYYVYNQSSTLDLKILLKTIGTVILKKGAY
ncbi:lipopolysaccharide/colanic/teichoic acid biosynthesis glycosyltransferase [Pullulanibacillus pueri]|uniref:Multidrug MFS transporter n=1 Tax=Pullulanibacillus pueri TaxID=1437324 RepID=A0A8J2ZXH7_9BACL|nr:sugar transferase [Pullulanibacillus pueri]MBM7681778.1 lipopolysaccharide/colanic/teichoic acid biosynthesis glycosyltransferase [Pullulanibacillus pueri]GGH84215.1 multidrug MFS transporter [Pullulanibacillus pueri]